MSYFEKMRVYKEMKNIGMEREEIILFSLIGFGLWGVLLWMFSERYVEINDDTNTPDDHLKNITIVILSFHIITLFFTLLESYYLNTNIWVSWITIGLAISATFLNASALAIIVTDRTQYENVNVDRAISSLVLQCIANSLMLAYIFRLIRSKRKMVF
tara:strand:+ start:54137 stop:54610 length:474 start_codon:yes stop_codon:yes gene_type:complete